MIEYSRIKKLLYEATFGKYRTPEERKSNEREFTYLALTEYLDKIIPNDNSPLRRELETECKKIFETLQKENFIVGCNTDVSILAILLYLLRERFDRILLAQSIESCISEEEFQKLTIERDEIDSLMKKIEIPYKEETDKALSRLNYLFMHRPNKKVFMTVFLKKIDPSFDKAFKFEEEFCNLFEIDKQKLKNEVRFEEEQFKKCKADVCKSFRNKSIKISSAFLLIMQESKKPRAGLMAVSCYLLASKYYEEGYWLKPKSQLEWYTFFKIDKKTFSKRLRELKSQDWEKLNNIVDNLITLKKFGLLE
jgi:hypothetical protein